MEEAAEEGGPTAPPLRLQVAREAGVRRAAGRGGAPVAAGAESMASGLVHRPAMPMSARAAAVARGTQRRRRLHRHRRRRVEATAPAALPAAPPGLAAAAAVVEREGVAVKVERARRAGPGTPRTGTTRRRSCCRAACLRGRMELRPDKRRSTARLAAASFGRRVSTCSSPRRGGLSRNGRQKPG